MKILVVEDQLGQTMVRTLKHILPESEIILSTDGTEGLLVHSQFKPDLVITDWNMPPGMHGGQLAKALKDKDPNQKIILWSGSTSNTFLGYIEYFDDILSKDVDSYQLQNTIEYVMQLQGKDDRIHS